MGARRLSAIGSLHRRSLGHSLSLASGRRLGSDLLSSLTTRSTSSAIRRAARDPRFVNVPPPPPATSSFHKAGGGSGSFGTGSFKYNASLEAAQSQQQPHLGTVREDPELEFARLSQLPAKGAGAGGGGPGPVGEGREAPYTVPDGVSPFAVGPAAPSGGNTVLQTPEGEPMTASSLAAYLGGGDTVLEILEGEPVAAEVSATAYPGGGDLAKGSAPAYLGGGELAKGSAAHSVLNDPTFLRTAAVAEHVTLLARLRGVGLYYTDNRCVWGGLY